MEDRNFKIFQVALLEAWSGGRVWIAEYGAHGDQQAGGRHPRHSPAVAHAGQRGTRCWQGAGLRKWRQWRARR